MQTEEEIYLKNNQEFNYWLFSQRAFYFILLLALFLIALGFLSESSIALEKDIDIGVKNSLNNPFISLIVGLFLSAVFQSSTLTTSMTVVLVGQSLLSFHAAIFIMMGANLGTTVTPLIVSLGYLSKNKELKKAVACAMLHHQNNLISVLILFPLEYYFGFISKISLIFTKFLYFNSFFGNILYSGSDISTFIKKLVSITPLDISPWIIFLLSITLLFITIKLFISLVKHAFENQVNFKLENYIFNNQWISLSIGTFFTGLIHSSSVVISLLVPFVASSRISVKKSLPFILGSNIGTTFTAIFAALSANQLAMNLAISHFMFNFFSLIFFFPTQYQRSLIIKLSKYLGRVVSRTNYLLIVYIILVFFVLPFIAIAISK